MHHRFVAIRIHGVGPEFAVQDIPVRMQDQPEVLAQRGELHFLDGVEGIRAVLGTPFHHPVHHIVLVKNFVVAQRLLQGR